MERCRCILRCLWSDPAGFAAWLVGLTGLCLVIALFSIKVTDEEKKTMRLWKIEQEIEERRRADAFFDMYGASIGFVFCVVCHIFIAVWSFAVTNRTMGRAGLSAERMPIKNKFECVAGFTSAVCLSSSLVFVPTLFSCTTHIDTILPPYNLKECNFDALGPVTALIVFLALVALFISTRADEDEQRGRELEASKYRLFRDGTIISDRNWVAATQHSHR